MVFYKVATFTKTASIVILIRMATFSSILAPLSLVVVALLTHALSIVLTISMATLCDYLPVLSQEDKFVSLFVKPSYVKNDTSFGGIVIRANHLWFRQLIILLCGVVTVGFCVFC
jgi:hypothetical protein